jgi:predicted enzyme related to lactoylglutathione lyase
MDRTPHILGLRTVIYAAPDLAKAKTFYSALLGVEPYFDEPFYVGYNVGGFELGLDPNKAESGAGGSLAYWGVPSITDALAHAKSLGATVSSDAQDVGEGIKVATILDPFGSALGLIENPHFDATKAR